MIVLKSNKKGETLLWQKRFMNSTFIVNYVKDQQGNKIIRTNRKVSAKELNEESGKFVRFRKIFVNDIYVLSKFE